MGQGQGQMGEVLKGRRGGAGDYPPPLSALAGPGGRTPLNGAAFEAQAHRSPSP